MRCALLTLVLVILAACGGPAPDTAAPAVISVASEADALRFSRHAELRRALFAVDAIHTQVIATMGPLKGLMAFFDDDATLLLAGENIITGRRAIRTALETRYPAGTTFAMSRTLAGGDVSADGDLGFTFGWYELSATPAGGAAVLSYGTYVSVWQREHGRPRVVAYFTRSYPTTHGAPRAGFPLLADEAGVQGARHPGSMHHQIESLLAVDSEFAATSVDQGFSIAFPAYAGDILLLTGGRDHYYLEGNAEVVDWYAGWTPAEVLDWQPVIAGASHSGDLGYTIGNSTDSYTYPDGNVEVAYGKYITLWLRQADGSWRFIADAGAASPAPAN